ncbi:MAG: alpha/beta fold hydrolase [Gammaproteobacteria bacterium]
MGAWIGCVIVAMLLLLVGCQRHLIYFPTRASAEALEAQARALGLAPWQNDAAELLGWRRSRDATASLPPQRLVVFHGNAGMALHRSYFRDGFEAAAAPGTWDFHVFEYPGYGARAGTPGEKAFVAAAAEALESLWREDRRPIFLLGESIGSGVACALAARYPQRIAGLILITPFTRLGDVAAHHYPFLPTQLLLRERYDNSARLAHYQGPLGVLLAEHDEIIPSELGRRLYEDYTGPKRLWVHEGASHNTLHYNRTESWWAELSDFLLRR